MDDLEAVETDLSKLRVAIVHYWFIGRGGGERVVESIAKIFPQADLFSLVADAATLSPLLRSKKLQTSFLQRVPGARKYHRHFLLLQPLALEQFDLSEYDLVISSESGPAKGVITSANTCHICYCHSPMRYVWDMYSEYRRGMTGIVRAIFTLVAHYMRFWDQLSASRVDYFVANSRFVASRIRKLYRRDCTVIHPPVQTAGATVVGEKSDYYIAIGRMVTYKRFDLAVSACTKLGRRLKVIGIGPEEKSLRRMAGPSVEFLGELSDGDLREELAGCRALLFPGEEDFGIVPVEAQSFGRPVIAYGSGGVLETVRGLGSDAIAIERATGLFFEEQTSTSLEKAILHFEAKEHLFNPLSIREHALQFDEAIFEQRMTKFIQRAMQEFRSRNQPSTTDQEQLMTPTFLM